MTQNTLFNINDEEAMIASLVESMMTESNMNVSSIALNAGAQATTNIFQGMGVGGGGLPTSTNCGVPNWNIGQSNNSYPGGGLWTNPIWTHPAGVGAGPNLPYPTQITTPALGGVPNWGVPNWGGGIGVGHQLSAGQLSGYGAGTADALYQLTSMLLTDKPNNNGKTVSPDAIYPCDYNITSSYLQFHLLVWRNSDEDRKKNFFDLVDITGTSNHMDIGLDGKLVFKTRQARRDFLRWWNFYTNTFFDGIPPFDLFLPRIKQGKITGVFVEEKSMLDHLPYQYSLNPTIVHNLARGLVEILPSWCWITANCRKPVFHHNGGWFFSRGADGAKLRLFFPKSAGASRRSFAWISEKLPAHSANFFEYDISEGLMPCIARLTRCIEARSDSVYLIGHSLGGLIVAGAATEYNISSKVAGVVTMCAPFGGISSATFMSMMRTDQIFKDISSLNPNLSVIRNDLVNSGKLHLPIIANRGLPIASHANDGVVSVSSQTAIDGITYHAIPVNHFEVLLSKEVVSLISDFIF